MSKLHYLFVLLPALVCLTVFAAEAKKGDTGGCCSIGKVTDLKLTVAERPGGKNGQLALRITVTNSGQKAIALEANADKKFTCIDGMFLTFCGDITSCSLCDFGKAEGKAHMHEIYIPAGACLSFDSVVPENCLPEDLLSQKQPVKLKVGLGCVGNQVFSNEIELKLGGK